MVRHARMLGRPTLWLPGLDHAGIAVQAIIDSLIAAEGETRDSLGRERYLERTREFVAASRDRILTQQRRLGGSLDWKRLRYTMDEISSRAVREAFARLHRDGLAYRTEALINWCPGCRTSVSDLEVIPKPETGRLWTVRYHLVDEATGEPSPTEAITVATTRPGDDPGRYGRRGPSRRRALQGARRAAGHASRSSSGTSRSSPTRSSTASSGPARSRSPRPTTMPTTRPVAATTCR